MLQQYSKTKLLKIVDDAWEAGSIWTKSGDRIREVESGRSNVFVSMSVFVAVVAAWWRHYHQYPPPGSARTLLFMMDGRMTQDLLYIECHGNTTALFTIATASCTFFFWVKNPSQIFYSSIYVLISLRSWLCMYVCEFAYSSKTRSNPDSNIEDAVHMTTKIV
jgi:hypothetical protein